MGQLRHTHTFGSSTQYPMILVLASLVCEARKNLAASRVPRFPFGHSTNVHVWGSLSLILLGLLMYRFLASSSPTKQTRGHPRRMILDDYRALTSKKSTMSKYIHMYQERTRTSCGFAELFNLSTFESIPRHIFLVEIFRLWCTFIEAASYRITRQILY